MVSAVGLLSAGSLFTLIGTRLISAMLFEVSPRDPAVLLGVSGCILAAAVAACAVACFTGRRLRLRSKRLRERL